MAVDWDSAHGLAAFADPPLDLIVAAGAHLLPVAFASCSFCRKAGLHLGACIVHTRASTHKPAGMLSCQYSVDVATPGPLADCVYNDPSGATPDAGNFAAAAAGLCSPTTRVLVAFELRTEQLREYFLAAVSRRFAHVELVPREHLPESYRVPHIELYQLQRDAPK